jgi:hypothetical protein
MAGDAGDLIAGILIGGVGILIAMTVIYVIIALVIEGGSAAAGTVAEKILNKEKKK